MNGFKRSGMITLVLAGILVFALVVAGCGGGAKPAEPAKRLRPPNGSPIPYGRLTIITALD